MGKIKVMIVDDQYIARQLFEMYIKSSEKYEVVMQVESAVVAAEAMEGISVDVVLMDILMSDGSNGLSAAREIKKSRPEVKIIAVTSMPETSWLMKAREIGIDSFWYKEASKETILQVMDRTMNGESVYPDEVPKVMLGMASSHEFTEREMEVLRLMTTGASNVSIAGTLMISESTVKNHIHRMLEKTGCESRTELAIEARINGIAIKI